MIALFDSRNPTKRPVIRGHHTGQPRLWVVQLRGDGLDEVVTFVPKQKVQISALADLVDRYILDYQSQSGRAVTNIRWTATAR